MLFQKIPISITMVFAAEPKELNSRTRSGSTPPKKQSQRGILLPATAIRDIIASFFNGKPKMTLKRVSESALEHYPVEVFPGDLNSRGTIFGGRVMALADKVGGYVAMRHSHRECVTLAVDSVRFLAPAKQGEILIFKAAVNKVWGSSLEVGVKVFAENLIAQTLIHILSAYFTFVAVDKNDKPIEIEAKLQPETVEEKRRYEEAEKRREYRLLLANRQI